MAKYKYRAADIRGRTVRGVMAAADEIELHEKLKAEGRYLTSAKVLAERQYFRSLKAMALADFCREVGMLLGAGVSLARALGIISQNESVKFSERAIYIELLRLIRQGIALSDAMESLGSTFPPMLVHMFRAAEAAGNMDVTANCMAEHYSKEHRLNTKVKNSTAYPKILCFTIVGVVAILIGYVLPQFESLFSMMDELPLPTRFLFWITNMASRYWYLVLIGIAVGIAVIRMACSIGSVRLWMDKMKVHLPLTGKLWRVIYTARFARTLSSLYSAGIPIVPAMQIARNSIGNTYIDKQLDRTVFAVRAGENLSDALEPIDGFIKKLAFSVRVGEETGSLDSMLDSTADALEYESETAVNKMISYLEPGLIIVMALVVGFIMIAVMMPIYESYSVIEASAYS